VICFGSGGHAKVVLDALSADPRHADLELAGLITATPNEPTQLGVPILGQDADLETIARLHSILYFVVGIGSIRGGLSLRPKLFEQAEAAGLQALTIVHPSAIVASSAEIGAGSVVLAGAVIQPGASIGRNVIINTRSSIDHDCRIDDHAHIAPGVTCSGGVRIGRNSHVGTGVVIIQGIHVGAGVTVGAGSLVLRDCDDGTLVYGSPARPH
jgi:UDP-perosamine 4-acetyltransferase